MPHSADAIRWVDTFGRLRGECPLNPPCRPDRKARETRKISLPAVPFRVPTGTGSDVGLWIGPVALKLEGRQAKLTHYCNESWAEQIYAA